MTKASNRINSFAVLAALPFVLALPFQAAAQAPMPAQAPGASAAPAAAGADFTEGEVRRVDMEQGRVTLRHGAIKNLQMPPMTMVFGVVDRALLQGLKPGDKIRFRATGDGGRMTLTEVQANP